MSQYTLTHGKRPVFDRTCSKCGERIPPLRSQIAVYCGAVCAYRARRAPLRRRKD